MWLDFIHRTRKEKKKVWDVLTPFLKKYISADQQTRVLLILFPKDLVEQIMSKDNPDGFIEEAITKHLAAKK